MLYTLSFLNYITSYSEIDNEYKFIYRFSDSKAVYISYMNRYIHDLKKIIYTVYKSYDV